MACRARAHRSVSSRRIALRSIPVTNRRPMEEVLTMKRLLLASVALIAVSSAAFAAGPKQGGQMVVTFKDDMATLDPAIGYDWQNWSIIKSLYSRLMDYEPGSTKLRADLAESYDIAPD